MLQSVGGYINFGAQVLETGLAHSTFMGRLVSWGIFYGALYLCVKKICEYAIPKIKEYMKSAPCPNCHETLKGEPVTPPIPPERVEKKKETPPSTSTQPGEHCEDYDDGHDALIAKKDLPSSKPKTASSLETGKKKSILEAAVQV